MLQNVWNFRSAISVDVSVNVILPQTPILRLARNGLRLTGDATNKLKADPEHKRTSEPAVISHREGWQSDCTKMLDLL
jgi:hypothetical protein